MNWTANDENKLAVALSLGGVGGNTRRLDLAGYGAGNDD
jgi:hypothetical protein